MVNIYFILGRPRKSWICFEFSQVLLPGYFYWNKLIQQIYNEMKKWVILDFLQLLQNHLQKGSINFCELLLRVLNFNESGFQSIQIPNLKQVPRALCLKSKYSLNLDEQNTQLRLLLNKGEYFITPQIQRKVNLVVLDQSWMPARVFETICTAKLNGSIMFE